jgi:hypothetical protein
MHRALRLHLAELDEGVQPTQWTTDNGQLTPAGSNDVRRNDLACREA